MDQVMIYAQRPDATACAEFDLWNRRMGRRVRRGSKGIALVYYQRGRPAVRYVFDVADTERRENGRDPVLWQYREIYEPVVTSCLENAFGIPGNDGLAKQLIALAVQFADEHWHDFGDRIMLSLKGSAMDGTGEDHVASRFRGAATVSLAFLLLGRCGFDLDEYFTPEDFACIGEFDTRGTVLALGNAVSESAGIILRQVERAVKACMSGKAISPPEPEAPSVSAPGPPQEAPGQLAMQGYPEPEAVAPGPGNAEQEPSVELSPVVSNFRITDDGPGSFGPKGRYVLNIEAIQVLRNIEADSRRP